MRLVEILFGGKVGWKRQYSIAVGMDGTNETEF
jgi:hypothetical protein